jgi:hypothetical protein
MFTAKEIRDLLQASPFRPFRIRLSDGGHYDVMNHDGAMVLKNYVEVGLNFDPDGIAEDVARCSILHITQIEDLPASPKRKKARKR